MEQILNNIKEKYKGLPLTGAIVEQIKADLRGRLAIAGYSVAQICIGKTIERILVVLK